MTSARLTVLAAVVSFLTGTSGVLQAQSISFELRTAATPRSADELVSLPTIAVVPAGSATISSTVAQQLGASIQLADAADYTVLTRTDPNSSGIRWAFTARTDNRGRYVAIAPAFADRLTACLYALEDDAQVAALVVLLKSATVSSQEHQSAALGGQMMLTHWRADACHTQRNSLVLIGQESDAILAVTKGMLTGRFDEQLFHGEPLLTLIEVLQPLFFEADGLWESEREPQLRAAFHTALQRGFPAASALDAASAQEFASFFDWVIYLRRSQPTLLRELFHTTAQACLASAAEASQAFQLQRCIEHQHIHAVSLRFDGDERFLLEPESTP